ncbi:MAG: radical SAM family heme chaperone HemW [Lachnospiraceae bacterium]|nr:radical SAM family heme chaperone HemW [Lachnospiraceae bacterium]
MEKKNNQKRPVGIYLHIPFCVRKCNYCDFLSAPAKEETRRQYVRRLQEEIRQYEDAKDYQVRSIFFGGGTPSILEPSEIAGLMETLRETFSLEAAGEERVPEITIECNPGTLTREKLRTFREYGINRLSLGLQSADEQELKLLGRIHTWEDFQANFALAREMGFENMNVDLMSALPGQTRASWKHTLEKVLALEPEHISAYSLIIEEGTPFYETYGRDAQIREQGGIPRWLPSEEEERGMYEDTEQILGQAGFSRYEISNYARPGFACIHNSGYWQRVEYVGFGLGASSQLKRLRYKNTDSLPEYLQGDFSKREVLVLTKDDEIEETMYLGLRMMEGVDLEQFYQNYQVPAEVIYRSQIEKLQQQGLLQKKGSRLRLTKRGIDVSNRVLAEFLLD